MPDTGGFYLLDTDLWDKAVSTIEAAIVRVRRGAPSTPGHERVDRRVRRAPGSATIDACGTDEARGDFPLLFVVVRLASCSQNANRWIATEHWSAGIIPGQRARELPICHPLYRAGDLVERPFNRSVSRRIAI